MVNAKKILYVKTIYKFFFYIFTYIFLFNALRRLKINKSKMLIYTINETLNLVKEYLESILSLSFIQL